MSELDRRLRDAGQAPVPPPDPAFATMLEERLRAGALAPEPSFRPAARPTGRRWPAVAAVAAALAVVIGVGGVLRGGGGEDEVRVASATDTVVVLPDGTVGPATPGLVIPDGSRLQTGSDGHVVAGETELGPKQEAKVNKGTVKPSPTTVPPKPSEPSNPPGTAPTATTMPVVEPTTPPSTAPTPPTTATPRPTKPPVVVTPTTKPTTRPTDTKPTTTSTSGPTANTPTALKLDARYKGTTVKLQWSYYGGKDFAAYLVLRADGPGEPTYPVNEKTTVVARITDPAATSFTETIADPAGRVYRVVAVDSERRLIASSGAAKPQPLA
jgi:hypothetical protein